MNIAPKNFWPYSYQFYLCNPVKTFQSTIEDFNTDPIIKIDRWIEPTEDRSKYQADPMPKALLSDSELELIGNSSNSIDEKNRLALPLRDDRIATARNDYNRF